jgi:hypothetical protein
LSVFTPPLQMEKLRQSQGDPICPSHLLVMCCLIYHSHQDLPLLPVQVGRKIKKRSILDYSRLSLEEPLGSFSSDWSKRAGPCLYSKPRKLLVSQHSAGRSGRLAWQAPFLRLHHTGRNGADSKQARGQLEIDVNGLSTL